MNKLHDGWTLVISIILCEGTGIASSWLGSAYNNAWFDALNKPSWNPPASIFAPIWTILYLCMAIALWLVWKSKVQVGEKRKAIAIFGIQLFFNFCWSIIFFRFQSPGIAFADILFLAITITITIFQFAKISKFAAWLLVPYVSWVCFAMILNYSIWKLN